jgi:2,3-bisphosphoglycerate-dependent phosphoglycerate mutase
MRIYLVRHGQSKSNLDWTENQRVADHAIELTEEGHRQAKLAGEWLKQEFINRKLLRPERKASFESGTPKLEMARTRLWLSPYTRTRQTADALEQACRADSPTTVFGGGGRDDTPEYRNTGESLFLDRREHLLLAEQQFGLFDGMSDEDRESKYPLEHAYYEKCKKFEGKLWPKMPLGESRFEVCQRVHQSFGTFKRDAEKHGITNIVVVAHGTVNRAFLMMWMHLPYEWMHAESNPNNCSIRLIENGIDMGFVFEGFPNPPSYKHSAPATKESEE